jgi:hypothetical protein
MGGIMSGVLLVALAVLSTVLAAILATSDSCGCVTEAVAGDKGGDVC